MKIKIITDSTADLSPELLEKYDIAVVPLYVVMGDKTQKDGLEVSPEDIYAYVDDDFSATFSAWREQGYEIVHFCISSDFSSSYQNARTAAAAMDGVYVVDTRNLSTGSGLVVLRGAELAQQGKSAAEIKQACDAMTGKVEASFVVDSIDYLHKGGRCSSVAALGANLLKLKPLIEVIDGKMKAGKKYRGNIDKSIISYVTDKLRGRADIDKHRIFITHTKCNPVTVQQVRGKINELYPGFEEILETTAGCTITSHCGPGTLGILFVRK